MPVRFKKIHPALKHAGYSATTLLPGEDSAAFEKLYRALITEFTPAGALEEDIVADMAHLIWRKRNLAIFRIAKLAKAHCEQIDHEKVPRMNLFPDMIDVDVVKQQEAQREGYRIAEEQARQELGDIYKLIDIGEPATIDGLMSELMSKSVWTV